METTVAGSLGAVLLGMPVSDEESNERAITLSILNHLASTRTSVAVWDATSGEELYAYNTKLLMKPASTMKSLTAGAALEYLGESFQFKTSLYVTGDVSKGVLHGDVYLKGGGDPTLSIEQLKQFAEALKEKGIKKITGTVYGDDKQFDRKLLTPGIVKEDETEYYAAQITALTLAANDDYDTGAVNVNVTGKKVGKKPEIKLTPCKGNLKITNNAKTVKGLGSITVERAYGTKEIVISGSISENKSEDTLVTVYDPSAYTIAHFKEELVKSGIDVSKKTKRKSTPKSAVLIKTILSKNLEKILIPYMKLSNNGIADILIKTLGVKMYREGSTAAGLRVLRTFAEDQGIDLDTWRFEDGSGMSHRNGVTTSTMNAYLYAIQKKKWYEVFRRSLPVAGQQEPFVGGTLKERLSNSVTANKVWAKTGSLSGVNTLAGYVQTVSGRTVIISIYVQGAEGTIPEIDMLVELIAKAY